MNNTRKMVFVGILIALDVILTRFFSITTPIVRVGFGFVAVSLAAMLYGPIIGGIVGAVADLIGMMLFPQGSYFPGFTVSAFLGGVIYGLFLYKKPKTIINIALTILTITIIVNLGLNTLWLSMLTGNAVLAIITPRIIKQIVLLPIQVITIYITWRYVGEKIEKNYFQY
ncbi:folate family ECF transporter S component [Irregularibacter muris]|uniref:Folate family ECF transporter S component n=1 Tax=Irregularibacter muris TaxID=1796619 RepID=A0AAE3L3D7_9FIRM|nr:folate family ECF transporter S component [Irregularibacter muris]MCR1900269.1 folate family ECF transporter S component [Irregularibacter muris]